MSLAETPEPKTADEETRFLSVSIPVVSGHLKHTVTVSRARDEIRHAALRLSLNLAGSNTRRLADKLEHATGCTIEALALQAERWPASAQVEATPADMEVAPAIPTAGGRRQ
jgi:hypothetical protein